MPIENNFQSQIHCGMPFPLQTHATRPFPLPAMLVHCSINYSRGVRTHYSMPPLDQFAHHSFGFEYEPPRNHMMSPQFSILSNIASPPNFNFPNLIPTSVAFDSRIMPFVSFGYPTRPPQSFFSSPPQIQFSPLKEPPISSILQVNGNIGKIKFAKEVGCLS